MSTPLAPDRRHAVERARRRRRIVASVRAEDESGSFGILPGHADLLTVLPPSVVRWHGADGVERFCAVDGGVLTVTAGRNVAIACREGRDRRRRSHALEAEVAAVTRDTRRTPPGAPASSRSRLHARAVRQLHALSAPEAGPMPCRPTRQGPSPFRTRMPHEREPKQRRTRSHAPREQAASARAGARPEPSLGTPARPDRHSRLADCRPDLARACCSATGSTAPSAPACSSRRRC